MFNAPIPGQSLTSEPKNYAWERPPQFSKPEDALMFHMERLEDPKKVKGILGLLELGLDVTTMTEGILRGAVADGRHSIDVSLIIAPVIHEYIVGTAEAAGVEYDEGFEDDEAQQEDLDYTIRERKAKEILKDIEGKKDIDLTPMMEESQAMPEEQPEMEQEQQQPMGLMARRM